MTEPRLLCGVSDGRGKLCGRAVNIKSRRTSPGRTPPYVWGICPKHGYVEILEDDLEHARTSGHAVVHLTRSPVAQRPRPRSARR